jgi:acetoacetyl-[acyl-carrier protein] synthase
MKLPVIVAIGGINSAGRTSGFHAYKRMVHQALPSTDMLSTWLDLSHRMKLIDMTLEQKIEAILKGTLIRKIDIFDPNRIHAHQMASVSQDFHIMAADLDGHQNDIQFKKGQSILWNKEYPLAVQTAGCLPKGFDPSDLYHSKHHPRGVSMTLYGMSDALLSLGIDWETVMQRIHPDQLAVYAGSALGQIDESSLGGIIGMPLKGSRISSKMLPLSLAEMPADFVNSYIINSLGTTGHNMGACATFLYNLRLAMQDIQSGRARVAIVGSAEAPIQANLIEGFNVMGALATDESLRKLDHSDEVNHRRACRPFSTNTGFVIAESSQFIILMADDLALELGVSILGSVPAVFVNADGNKKSISSPGVGNYITMAKSAALAKSILGERGLQDTFVQAHGTGTPQNRVTESHILNEVAKSFGIEKWKVAAIKSYVGHSVGVAAGDQLTATLGAWHYGIIPGIETIDHIADDVYDEHLDILMQHCEIEKKSASKGAILNAKGFGGNNASALVLSPEQTMKMLECKYGNRPMKQYQANHEVVQIRQKEEDELRCSGNEKLVYHFGNQVLDMDDVSMSSTKIQFKNYNLAVELPQVNPYVSYVNSIQD